MPSPNAGTGNALPANESKNGSLPSVSIGVITLENRAEAFRKLLDYLSPAIRHYAGDCEVVIGNNSGASTQPAIEAVIDNAGLRDICPVTVVNSPQNNIATARNLLLEETQHSLIAFIDDDEYPAENWLSDLVSMQQASGCTVVAGPVHAVFDPATARWITQIDLHNTRHRVDGGEITMTGTGNVLIDKRGIDGHTFKESFGKTGGSDTEFFLRISDAGARMLWADSAVAYEDIPADRASARYLLRRFMSQGANYRRVMTERERIPNQTLFSARALLFVIGSLPIALALLVIRHPRAGDWMKRAFSNLGKIYTYKKKLYE